MKELKTILQKKQVVFCLGTDERERYDFFKVYLSQKFKAYIPNNNSCGYENHTFVFFVSEQEEGYYENERGEIISLFHKKPNDSIKNIYLPISKRYLPCGFIYVLPPPQGKTREFITYNEPFNFDYESWIKNLHKIIWFDFFPYAEASDINTLEVVKDCNILKESKADITVAFMLTGRRYAFSDITNESEAVEMAKKIYYEKRVGDSHYLLELGDKKEKMIEILTNKKLFIEKIKDRVLNDINQQHEMFIKYFYEDYYYEIDELLSVEKLDKICSYEKWIKYEGKSLARCWFDAVNEEIFNEFKDKVYSFIYESYLRDIILMKSVEEFENILTKKWASMEIKVLRKLNNKKLMSKDLSRLEYLDSVKDNKIYFKQTVDKFIREDLKKAIYKFINDKYAIWGNVKETLI
ncbi:hypothetical protein SH2C18_45310 [Clostridium sediminicola]|uniref:hypothetical protein n=1 Tax=Clostridium sediminicola TaxID=3114879 RepID=UPI0031F20367